MMVEITHKNHPPVDTDYAPGWDIGGQDGPNDNKMVSRCSQYFQERKSTTGKPPDW